MLCVNLWPADNGTEIQHILPGGTPKENGEIYESFLDLSETTPENLSESRRDLFLPFLVTYCGREFIAHIGFIFEVYSEE